MSTIHLSAQIAALRKRAGITQEQLAAVLCVSAQAVSKWETGVCMPDLCILPQMAEYFGVSIDCLFYGTDTAASDLYTENKQRVAAYEQMSENAFEEALCVYASAHHGISHGISHGNMRGSEWMYDEPSHLTSEGGLSLLSGKGYGALITRRFFENVDEKTIQFSVPLLKALADTERLTVVSAIISMSGISFTELKEKLAMDENSLRQALKTLCESGLVVEEESKHQSLGKIYEIQSMFHTCLCILLATLEMQRFSLKGISCCMKFGDFPIQIQWERNS